VKLARIAKALPPRSDPKNNQFLRPIANGFTALSAVLLSMAQSPLVGVRPAKSLLVRVVSLVVFRNHGRAGDAEQAERQAGS
jgi:hypothetical protein